MGGGHDPWPDPHGGRGLGPAVSRTPPTPTPTPTPAPFSGFVFRTMSGSCSTSRGPGLVSTPLDAGFFVLKDGIHDRMESVEDAGLGCPSFRIERLIPSPLGGLPLSWGEHPMTGLRGHRNHSEGPPSSQLPRAGLGLCCKCFIGLLPCPLPLPKSPLQGTSCPLISTLVCFLKTPATGSRADKLMVPKCPPFRDSTGIR